ncbi:Hypothetical protein IALB_0846 [Ignavibacterium album JCM 16511]|uniref:Secretion system C-terminal sorting domain-containing protein n=1 Tax=Ignavibacterium album (strain DSM 19864 / JCM 16511 / NBRC 101810 / Mat9-16) TaxID=945713 RepID=I0AHV1_IGNAJ|nr:T9SS type A sorting domain-containing protein [Ignavibacterium album]AFH48558.1 Hypothetical protein IALB_0846 [Ignavibacterium album JCM 16511]
MIKKLSVLMILLFIVSSISFAQLVGGNTYPINGTDNPPVSFQSISSAVAYLTANGVTGTGDVILELSTGYTGDTSTISIGVISGTSSTTKVVFRPATGYSALTEIPGGASPNQHAIRITGNYIVLDGRAGGVGTSRDWTIRTTGTNGQMAVRLDNTSNSMTGVELRYLVMEAEAANTTGAIFQITGSTTNTITNIIVEENLIRSNPLVSTFRGYGITLASASNAGNTGIIVRNNIITQFYARGINLTGGFPGIEVYGNEIYHTADVTQPTTTEFSAIYFSTTASPGAKIYNNYIHDIRLTNGSTAINGLYIFNGNSSGASVQYFNNRISIGGELSGTAADLQVYGLRENALSGSLIDIYFNSVYVGGTAASGTNNSAAFRKQVSNFVNLKNNIFYNARTNSGGTGTHWAIMSNNITYSSIGNNDYFADGTGGVLGTTDGTTAGNKLTISAWQAAVPSDAGSVSQNPNFVAGLKINETIPTQLESGGAPIAGITTDFEGDLRNATTPDIGADEFTGTPLDLTPPLISYNLLPNALFSNTSVSLTATITDLSGVATGANAPRLYIKKSTDVAYVFDDNPTVSGHDYTFTINYSAIGGIVIGDTIQYYVAAQDVNGNVGTNPAGGSGSNPPGTTPPSNPNFYFVVNTPLSGVYTVGLNAFKQRTGREIYFEERTRTVTRNLNGIDAIEDFNANLNEKENQGNQPDTEPRYVTVTETYLELMENGQPFNRALYQTEGIEGIYPTLTEAVNDLLLRGASGPITFQLVDSNYPNENYPINLTAFNGSSSTNTVTIKPAPNVQAVIPGSSTQTTASIWLQSGGYYIIDGSNTVGGTSKDLTIRALATSPAIHFYSSGNNNIIKNCIIESQNTSTGSGSLILAAGTGSNNNLIENCLFQPIQSATPYAVGVYLFSSFTGANNLISNCEFKDFSARAITIQGAAGSNNNDAVGNLIYQTAPSTATIIQSIYLGRAENTDITENQIYNLQSTSTSPTIAGIYYIGASGVNMNVRMVNNVISFGNQNPAGTIRGIDYFGYSANSCELYYNSVLLTGTDVTGTTSSAAIAKRDAASNFFMIDNIFENRRANGTGTGFHFAVQFTNTTATTFNLNYNDYFANGTGGVLGQWGTTNTVTLNDWQTASTQDANSLNANPQFASTSDLRPLYGSAVIDAGTPVSGITTDILGAVRDSLTPTLGAYENPTAIIGWANLQWPPTDTIYVGSSTTVYAQIWIDGITNQPGPGVGIQAWIGVNSSNTDPSTWTTWIPAVYNVDVGNNDEYMAAIGSSLAPGTYYYASRFNVIGGNYVYGGYSPGGGGFWDGINNVSGILVVKPPLIQMWQRSVATSNLPSWFGADTERGLAYGKTSDVTEAINDRVYVVSRSGGVLNVRILDAATGNDIGTLNTTGISGGTFALNDIGVTEDGKIIGANLTANASTSALKFYYWNNESSVPDTLFTYLGDAVRLGDKFTVVGNYSAGTAEIWAASATTGQHKVYKWTMSGGVFNRVPQVILCSDNLATAIGSAAVGPLPNGDFYWNANGQNARKYQANGTLIGIIPGTIISTGTNAIRYLGSVGSDEYLAVFAYGSGNNNARILRIPNGDPTAAVLYGVTPTLGSATNTNGTGDVDFKVNNDLTVTVFVLATNNGIGAYTTDASIPVELTGFVANVIERDVLLNWSTATETNNLGFEVERKTSDNNSWKKIAFIKSAGTTTEPQQYTFRDARLESGSYSYRLKIVDFDGTFSYSQEVEVEIGIPQQYALSQNYPNPFNPATRIDYQLPFDAKVQIELYSITGEKVATLVSSDISAGYHTIELNASTLNLASGVYFYRINAVDINNGKFVETKKLVLLK